MEKEKLIKLVIAKLHQWKNLENDEVLKEREDIAVLYRGTTVPENPISDPKWNPTFLSWNPENKTWVWKSK